MDSLQRAPPPSGKSNPLARAGALCARHGQACAAIIIALVIVLVLLVVVYRGVGGLGPFRARAPTHDTEITQLIQRIERAFAAAPPAPARR